MIDLSCDYTAGAHPDVLKALIETNNEQLTGYSEDHYCSQAREMIRQYVGQPKADVHFLVGGTQTNMVFIASVLRPHQGAVCADSGHINVHETGAIEACGHKVLALPSPNGKLTAQQVDDCFTSHANDVNFEHIVQPGLVYISQPTECGSLYTKDELNSLYNVCQQHNAPLYIDGARLAYALGAPACNHTIKELANSCDAFYIGGTKVGALFGEALVINNPLYTKDFRYIIKQKGALLAKGRLLGVQFKALMSNGLYETIGQHAVALAQTLKQQLETLNVKMLYDSPTNQIFPILPQSTLNTLSHQVAYSYWCKVDEQHDAVRFCTSWETTEADINHLISIIKNTMF